MAALVVVLIGYSAAAAVLTPGNEPFKAKWADWLRSHHASALVTPVESWYYSATAPSKGGRPARLNALPGRPDPSLPSKPVASTPSPVVATTVVPPSHLPAPAPVPLVVAPALAEEGQWQAVGPTVNGVPAMYEAQFRADTTYTSQITSAVWIDPTLLHVSLVPGAEEPGGSWAEPPDLTGTAAAQAVAAFNGGFRFQDAHGGFYLDGRQAVPLVDGAASAVIYRTGRVDVGAWGSEVHMTPDVVAVLQNLVPIVDAGQPAPSATYGDTSIWGATLGANTVVARSGLGVTATGGLVYVAGPALTAKSLAESLARAGAIRAMTLDINPEWVTFNFFEHPAGATTPAGVKLYPQMQRPADRYLGPTPESRDFFVVSTPAA
jgi:hypothetical protein